MLFPNNGQLRIPLFLLTVFLFGACKNFINLERIGFAVYPDADNTILPGGKTALFVRFDTSMDKPETQKILAVQFSGGTVKGDIAWHGDELSFVPLENWLPGMRYTLILDGTIYAKDGREDRVKRNVPFYALTREAAPFVAAFTPLNGASVGVHAEDGAFIRIVFSRPMERQSAVDAFYIDGMSERNFIWFNDDTVMEVHPKTALNPWTVYRWSLSTEARGKSGVPLGSEASGTFVTDRDRILPAVSEVFPLIRGGESSGLWWIKTGAAIETGFGSGQAIGIEFNKPMDESALRAIRFDPPLPGRSEMWKPNTVVFIPDRDPEPERIYTLYISADARDSGGLKMEKEFSLSFIADIPYLTFLSLDAGFGGTTPKQNGIYPARSAEPEGICTVILRFSHTINEKERAAVVLALRLETFFPGTLRPVSFRSARWWSADTVVLQWEGIEQSAMEEKHYYRLVLPGGRSGISDGKGSYLKEDMFFYLEIETGGP